MRCRCSGRRLAAPQVFYRGLPTNRARSRVGFTPCSVGFAAKRATARGFSSREVWFAERRSADGAEHLFAELPLPTAITKRDRVLSVEEPAFI